VAGRVTSPRFIGRERELAALDAALTDARAGSPSGVLVSGEAGVGKSRLIAEFAATAGSDDALVLVGHCVEVAEGELPYAPIASALRAMARELDPGDLDAVLGPARAELGLIAPDLLSGAGGGGQ
jgi:predicted ATPase